MGGPVSCYTLRGGNGSPSAYTGSLVVHDQIPTGAKLRGQHCLNAARQHVVARVVPRAPKEYASHVIFVCRGSDGLAWSAAGPHHRSLGSKALAWRHPARRDVLLTRHRQAGERELPALESRPIGHVGEICIPLGLMG